MIIIFNNKIKGRQLMTQPKQLSQQKILQILQTCKQIPKDDRLYLRKMIKDGDQDLLLIISDFNNKKLQIKLRKYIQKCKQNKKNQFVGNVRHNTIIDVKAITREGTPNHYRMALSLEKNKKKSLQAAKGVNVRQFRQQRQNFSQQRNILRASCGNLELGRHSTSYLNNQLKYPNPLTSDYPTFKTKEQMPKYTLQNNYLKQYQSPTFNYSCSASNLLTPSNFLNWQSLKMPSSQNIGQQSNQNSMYSSNNINSIMNPVSSVPAVSTISNSLSLSPIPVCNTIKDEQSLSAQSLLSRLKNSEINIKQERSTEKQLYNFKSALIKCYAEDVFDYIVSKHFPISTNQKSVYLPYRQFISQLQTFLRNKGQNVEFSKETDVKIPLIQPFTGEFQAITLKNMGQFLNRLCLHKNNQIRSIFIVLDAIDRDNNGVSVEKFRRINSWKGEELIQNFERLVKKWGENSSISYWQMYRAKKQQQFVNFQISYTKI